MPATVLLRSFHYSTPALLLGAVAVIAILALAAPILKRIREVQGAKSDAYKAARASARIEAQIERERDEKA